MSTQTQQDHDTTRAYLAELADHAIEGWMSEMEGSFGKATQDDARADLLALREACDRALAELGG